MLMELQHYLLLVKEVHSSKLKLMHTCITLLEYYTKLILIPLLNSSSVKIVLCKVY